ncbi:MAG TPA: hypothetical protein PLN41_06645 [Methanothrix sp.]|jgi:hypothetical protein|nr:hypothetical protein [Methanothrix sp.]OPY52247.1 MAG: hypothetical protein A4E51_01393 [Methanosaeta sp. PtaU1.Bin055]HNT73243.1 hypothetical protein [Methanothrix sp.]HOI69404.1 hypothetical protein [Methanothrix sp.]
MRCDICARESETLFKARHRDRGGVKICEGCLRREMDRLVSSSGGSCC